MSEHVRYNCEMWTGKMEKFQSRSSLAESLLCVKCTSDVHKKFYFIFPVKENWELQLWWNLAFPLLLLIWKVWKVRWRSQKFPVEEIFICWFHQFFLPFLLFLWYHTAECYRNFKHFFLPQECWWFDNVRRAVSGGSSRSGRIEISTWNPFCMQIFFSVIKAATRKGETGWRMQTKDSWKRNKKILRHFNFTSVLMMKSIQCRPFTIFRYKNHTRMCSSSSKRRHKKTKYREINEQRKASNCAQRASRNFRHIIKESQPS